MGQSEKNYTTDILDELGQIVYIADMDSYELLYVNELGRKTIGCGNDYFGKKCYEVLQGLSYVCPFCRNECLTNDGKTCQWDHYNEKLGVYFQLQDRQISYDGRRARIEIAIDISEREVRQAELRNALAEQRMLTDCVRTLNGNSPIEERIGQVLANIGKYYQADRAYLFDVSADGRRLNNTFEWCADGIAPQIGTLQGVDFHYIDRWEPSFMRKEAVVEQDIELIRSAYPDEYQIMSRQGIHSYMEAPLFDQGKFAGFLGVDNPVSEMISNSSAPILTMAYSVSNALVRDTDRQREIDRYEYSLHEMMTAVPNAVGILRFNLTRDFCRAEAAENSFFGISQESGSWDRLISRMLINIPDPEEKESFQGYRADRLLARHRAGNDQYSLSYRYAGADRRVHYVLTRLKMVRNPDTEEVEGVAYSLDLSKEIRQNEIFRIITDRSFDLVALIHLDNGTFEAVFLGESLPDEYRRMLPEQGAVCSFGEFCAKAVRYMDPETQKEYQDRLQPEYMRRQLDEHGGTYEFVLKESFPSSGREYMYRKFLHYRLDSDPNSVLVIESDETEATRRQQQELQRVRDEAEHDRQILDSLLDGIAVLKLNGQSGLSVDYFNSYVFQMLGYDPKGMPQRYEDAVGTPYEGLFADALSFIHPDDRAAVREAFRRSQSGESFALKPFRMYGKDHQCFWMLERVRPGFSAGGERIFYAAFHDVTEQVELQGRVSEQLEIEKQLRRAADRASAAKTDFLSRMSHDMRTPLNGVIGMTYLAQEQQNPPYTAECLEKISTSAKFLLGLINNILDMSKVESGRIELHPEPYPITEFNDYLDAVIRPLCEGKSQKFVLEEDIDIHRVPVADKNSINQVLFNLLSNAVKFTPEGGTVTYRIKAEHAAEERVLIEHQISDTGIGISREFRERLFEPFSQESRSDVSEQRGSGLGLSIVKKLVDLMGGTIAVQSAVGQGTTFTVRIAFDTVPAVQVVRQAPAVGQEDLCALAGKRVLLCEDHPLNQEIAKRLMAEKGMRLDVAENGDLGVKRFAVSGLSYYDAILMDIRMPVMDGYAAAKAIRALDRSDAREIPIIAMTADAFADSVMAARKAGMDGYVTKPVDPAKLYGELTRLLRKRQAVGK